MADGDSHDTSMERNSGVVAASALRLYERNTLPLQHVDTSIPGANSLDVLSELEVGPSVHVVSPTRALTGRFRAKATAQQEDAGLQSPTKASPLGASADTGQDVQWMPNMLKPWLLNSFMLEQQPTIIVTLNVPPFRVRFC